MKKRLAALTGIACLLVISALPVRAINYSSGTYGSCQYDNCSITLISNGSVNLNVTPTPGGACTVQSDIAAVFTDNSNGFSLTLSNSTTNTALVNGASTINASSGTVASPAALTPNAWGYRVDGTGGFGTGPTSAGTNIPPNSTTFAGPPASNLTAHTIANTAAPANPTVNVEVWYGVCANTSVINGSYTTAVTYTAVTN
jgi:hypothetical protein